ncbi:MAG: Phosphoglycolate phosphatase [Firmicutes bacterium ADurb.Bin182]|nr:MAG: Phosphoglycolate phosphatase [Firmicutes bacterium ADurb.Bin182]
MKFKAIVFDIDGCLIDSAPNLIKTLGRAILDTGGGNYGEESLRGALGLSAKAAAGLFDVPDWEQTHRKWCEYYEPLIPENKPFDGIIPLLKELKSRGYLLGVATSQDRWMTEVQFPSYPVAPYFDLIVCADDVNKPKPAGDPLLFCAERFGIRPSEILFIGDAPYDMQCAKAAGAMGALALWGTPNRDIPADYYPETPMDVLGILDEEVVSQKAKRKASKSKSDAVEKRRTERELSI